MTNHKSIVPMSVLRMTISLAVVVSAIVLLPIAVSRSIADEIPEEFTKTDLTYISYIQEICNLSQQSGESIWPGLEYSQIPMLLYRPDSVAFLINHPDPPSGFKSVERVPRDFQGTVYKYPGRFEDYTGQFWPVADINGHITFVCPYDEREQWEKRFFCFVVHEAFHTFQAFKFQEMGDTDEKLYPITLAENNALATLENIILAEATAGLITRDREEVIRKAREFAIVKEYRLQQAPPFVRQHEQVIERIENTAFYVEKRCQETGNSPGYVSTGFVEYTNSQPYLTHEEVLENLRESILEHVKGGAMAPIAMPRYRTYDNGAALGYILDFLDIDWKREVMSDSSFLFHRRLMQGLDISTEKNELDKEIRKLKNDYDFEEILVACRRNVEEYLAETEALKSQIRAAGEISFQIILNVKGGLSKSKRSSKRVLYADEGRLTLIEEVEQFLVKTANASVTVRNTGLIFTRPQGDNTATVQLFADEMPVVITINGQEQRLIQGVYSSHSSLLLELGDILRIEGKSGTITVTGNSVQVDLE